MLIFKHMNLGMLVYFILIEEDCNKLQILMELAVLMPIHYLTDLNLVSMVMMHYCNVLVCLNMIV